MEVVIKRIEIDMDSKGRQVVHETRVLDLNGYDACEELNNLVDDIYTNKDGEGIDFDVSSDNIRELEVYGDVIMKYFDRLDKKYPEWNARQEWKEDGINRKGEPFDVANQVYSVEVIV